MSLKVFHICFITVSTMLFAGMGVWFFDAYAQGRGSFLYPCLGVGSFIGGAALVYYGVKFLKKIKAFAQA